MTGKCLLVAAILSLVMVPDALAFRWPAATAAAKVKATYRTADTVRLASAQERLDRDLAAGIPETDPRVIRDRGYVAAAKTGGVPDTVKCAGVGRPVRARFSKFRCTAHVIGEGEWATDGFSATAKLTLVVTGSRSFRLVNGWR